MGFDLHRQLSDDSSGPSFPKQDEGLFSPAARALIQSLGNSGSYRGDHFGAWLAWYKGTIITAQEEDALLTPQQIAEKYPWLAYIYNPKKK